jgi:anti-sigma B factor antagonist
VSTLARLEDEWHDEVPVARLHGEVDASNVKEIGDRLRSLLSNRSVAMVVDLAQTTYLDSAGINLLFALGEEMRGRQQRLGLVVSEASPISRMIVLTGLDQAVPVRRSLADALAEVGADGA